MPWFSTVAISAVFIPSSDKASAASMICDLKTGELSIESPGSTAMYAMSIACSFSFRFSDIFRATMPASIEVRTTNCGENKNAFTMPGRMKGSANSRLILPK